MASLMTQIELAQLHQDFTRAYQARDKQLLKIYSSQLHSMLIAIACGGVAL